MHSKEFLKKFFILVAFIFQSCAYGPETKSKSALEALNGKHYETFGYSPGKGVMGIPIAKRRRASVRVSGTMVYLDHDVPAPVMNQELDLLIHSQIVAHTRTHGDGTFQFLGDFPDGEALIRIENQRFKGERSIRIKGFEMEKINFLVNRLN